MVGERDRVTRNLTCVRSESGGWMTGTSMAEFVANVSSYTLQEW